MRDKHLPMPPMISVLDLIKVRGESTNHKETAPLALLRGILLGSMISVGFWLAALYTVWLLTFVPGPIGFATLP
jgi:hypothetical protein